MRTLGYWILDCLKLLHKIGNGPFLLDTPGRDCYQRSVPLQEQNSPPAALNGLRGDRRRPTSRVSFIIPVFNGLSLTRSCLDSLRKTVDLSEHEVIVVDDRSTDGTREYLNDLPVPPFRILANDRRRGYAASNNIAASVATGEWLCLLNNDTVLPPPLARTDAMRVPTIPKRRGRRQCPT